MEQLKKITQEEISPTLHAGREDSPDLGTEGMQELFDAHPNLNTSRQNENTDIQNRNNTAFEGHMSNTQDPHQTTKAQVGLGSADDTSDINKPVSTAQQAALDTKADISYVDTRDTAILGSAKVYTDTGLASKANTIDVTNALALKASIDYADSGDLRALEDAKTYAREVVVNIGTGDMAQAIYDPWGRKGNVFEHIENGEIHALSESGDCPNIRIGATITDPTIEYTAKKARYSRNGNLIIVQLALFIKSITGGSGEVSVKGLPYPTGDRATPKIFPIDIESLIGVTRGFSCLFDNSTGGSSLTVCYDGLTKRVLVENLTAGFAIVGTFSYIIGG